LLYHIYLYQTRPSIYLKSIPWRADVQLLVRDWSNYIKMQDSFRLQNKKIAKR